MFVPIAMCSPLQLGRARRTLKGLRVGVGANFTDLNLAGYRSADTVVVTPSDQTVVIGGLISTQVIDQENKVPLLGDIPVIGYLFKRTARIDDKTELLFGMCGQGRHIAFPFRGFVNGTSRAAARSAATTGSGSSRASAASM